MNSEALARKRDAYETKIRKKAHDEFIKANRQRIIQYLDTLPYNQSITIDQAVRNITEERDVPESLKSLISVLTGQLEEREKYTHIMHLVDDGMVYSLLNMVIGRRHLHLAVCLMVAMSGLHQKKTCRSFINSGLIPHIVQLLYASEGDWELCSRILNLLGNIAVEDINYRDILMKNDVHSWIIERVNRQLQQCSCIYTEDSPQEFKRMWHFCFWYLQMLGQYEEFVFDPQDIVQFAVRFVRPQFPPEIVQYCLAIMNDLVKHVDSCLAEFNQCLIVLVAELLKKEEHYSKEVIHSVCYFQRMAFPDLQPFFYLINPHYFTQTPMYTLHRKSRFMLCKVVLNNIDKCEVPAALQDEFYWNDLILQASASNERTILIKLLTQIRLDRGKDQWAFRFILGSTYLDTELKQVLAAMNFLLAQLRVKEKEYVKTQMDKYGISLHLQQLQKKKNSLVYQRVEQILAFYAV